MTPEQMREKAAEQRRAAKEQSRQAMQIEREADQLEHQANLIDAADRAEFALEAVRSRAPGLDAAVEGANAAAIAKREAADGAERFLAAARAAETEADETRADPAVRADAAVRVAKADAMVAEARRELAVAEHAREVARQARVAYVGEEAEARRAYEAASRAAADPGTAPRTSPLALGLGGTSDLTEEERRLFALAAIAALHAPGAASKPEPTPARQDPSGLIVPGARVTVALPRRGSV